MAILLLVKSLQLIRQLLRGKIDPSIKSLFYIASVLDISFEKLLK